MKRTRKFRRFWKVWGIALWNLKRDKGMKAALRFLFSLLLDRDDDSREFRRRVLRDILLVAFAIWLVIEVKPWIAPLWAAVTDGVRFQRPQLPFTLPPVSLDDLRGAFIHYGWLLFVVALLIYYRLAAIFCTLTIAFLLFLIGGSLAWVYALVIGARWSGLEIKTNEYFSFGHYLPINMPMQTFMQDWGIFLGVFVVWCLWDSRNYQENIRDGKLQNANKLSGSLPSSHEATSDDLRNGGLL